MPSSSPLIHAPEDVLGAVATDAEIGGVARGVILVPDVRAAVAPEVGDGIAHEQNVNAALFRLRHKALVALEPSRIARHRDDGSVGDNDRILDQLRICCRNQHINATRQRNRHSRGRRDGLGEQVVNKKNGSQNKSRDSHCFHGFKVQ